MLSHARIAIRKSVMIAARYSTTVTMRAVMKMSLSFDFQVEYIKNELDDMTTPEGRKAVIKCFMDNELYDKEAIVKAMNDLGIDINFRRH